MLCSLLGIPVDRFPDIFRIGGTGACLGILGLLSRRWMEPMGAVGNCVYSAPEEQSRIGSICWFDFVQAGAFEVQRGLWDFKVVIDFDIKLL